LSKFLFRNFVTKPLVALGDLENLDKINMPRIAGINIPDNKPIEIALTYIYGIGRSLSKRILAQAKIDPGIRTNKLPSERINRLREIVEKEYKVEGELRQVKMMNIKRLKDISSYRGSRHSKGLPARGQKTKTNTRTVRGNVRRTMGSGRKKSAEKT
jgi:small subunit ribosomal protein S13|tara:strand:+ start:4015 stop:4485 length:471 start_codon:yes stop_codon:yes gene_type:complete